MNSSKRRLCFCAQSMERRCQWCRCPPPTAAASCSTTQHWRPAAASHAVVVRCRLRRRSSLHCCRCSAFQSFARRRRRRHQLVVVLTNETCSWCVSRQIGAYFEARDHEEPVRASSESPSGSSQLQYQANCQEHGGLTRGCFCGWALDSGAQSSGAPGPLQCSRAGCWLAGRVQARERRCGCNDSALAACSRRQVRQGCHKRVRAFDFYAAYVADVTLWMCVDDVCRTRHGSWKSSDITFTHWPTHQTPSEPFT